MKIARLLKRDIELGTAKNWFKFSVVIIFAVSFSCFLSSLISEGIEIGLFHTKGTAMDYLLYITQGMEVFHFSPEKYFNIPIYWFVFQIGISYIIAYYPEKDFKNYGKKIFLSTGSRVQWWLSKCIWTVINVLLYFCILAPVTLGIALFHGADMNWNFSEEIMTIFFGEGMQSLSMGDAWFICIILPCLMTVALSMLQVLLSFILTPVVSFAAMCGIYIISAYYTFWLLPGNYTMWMRSSYVTAEGIDPLGGIFLALFIMIASISAGCIYFKKCDVL